MQAQLEEDVACAGEHGVRERVRLRAGEAVVPDALEHAELAQHVREVDGGREVRLEIRVEVCEARGDGVALELGLLELDGGTADDGYLEPV